MAGPTCPGTARGYTAPGSMISGQGDPCAVGCVYAPGGRTRIRGPHDGCKAKTPKFSRQSQARSILQAGALGQAPSRIGPGTPWSMKDHPGVVRARCEDFTPETKLIERPCNPQPRARNDFPNDHPNDQVHSLHGRPPGAGPRDLPGPTRHYTVDLFPGAKAGLHGRPFRPLSLFPSRSPLHGRLLSFKTAKSSPALPLARAQVHRYTVAAAAPNLSPSRPGAASGPFLTGFVFGDPVPLRLATGHLDFPAACEWPAPARDHACKT